SFCAVATESYAITTETWKSFRTTGASNGGAYDLFVGAGCRTSSYVPRRRFRRKLLLAIAIEEYLEKIQLQLQRMKKYLEGIQIQGEEALTRNLTSLQQLQEKALKKDIDGDDAPEQVKSTTIALPALSVPEGSAMGILLQDWLAQVAVPMQDLSASSGGWWSQVLELVQATYATWLSASPIERLQLEPRGHEDLTKGKWTRVNARACSLMLQALPEGVKHDLISRRIVQSSPLILFRLHTTYQPGGASERSTVLNNLQHAGQFETMEECMVWLRAWPRWIQRCKDLKMMVPDGSVLARSLTSTTSKFLMDNMDAQFRTQLLRSSLRIDSQPSQADVSRYQQHLQAEIEALIASKPSHLSIPARVKAMGATSTPGSPTSAGASGGGKSLCKYFFRSSGCRRGAKCPFSHDMQHLSKAERAKRCLVCGGEDHRQRECPTKVQRPNTRTSPTGGGAAGQRSTEAPAVAVAKVEPEGEVSPSSTTAAVVSGEPVWTLETLLQAAAKVAGASPASGPSINVVSLKAHYPLVGDGQTLALVDSGATHALRQARSEAEWQQASPVVVNLAGGESISLRMNEAGTILVPTASSTTASSSAPIVPLGALVGQLGYTMTWSSNRCKLEGRDGDAYNLRVREGCPEIAEQDALRLIARLEDDNLELLRSNTVATRRRVKAAALAMERTWFDYLMSYVDGAMASEALKAIESAPFLQEVPKPCKAGLVESFPEANGWESLKGLEHLNRRTRKRLWNSDKWLVHLFCGKQEKKDLQYLEGHGYAVLELDIERGRTQDILRPSVWRALEYAARLGKIAAIVGGPPQSTFMISRHVPGGPEPVRSPEFLYGGWPGQPDMDVYKANRETQLLTRMIYLHALSTAGRLRSFTGAAASKEVAFLLEHPRDPRSYLQYGDPLHSDVVSLWRTSLWTEYAMEAGLNSYSFDMAAFGKAFTRHTTVGTNLQLKHLDGLRARWHAGMSEPDRAPACVWPKEFYEHLVIALRGWGVTPRMVRMSADQWREHVRRGHLPFRPDCAVCVQAGATGRRHARIEHPSAFVLSADLAGPVKIGGLDPDARGAYPKPYKYIFVAKLRVPKTFVEDGRGAWVDYDTGELEEDKYEDQDDGLSIEGGREKEVIRPKPVDDGDEGDEDQEEPAKKKDPEEDLDLAAPELVNLIFAAGIKDDKAPTVLEAIQDVILYCQALNIPVLRFHSDRGMEFQARASKQWLKSQGIRVTTSEAGDHRTNGAAESTVRWIKQRARTLLLSAKLPQQLWPMAASTAATMQRAEVLGFEPVLAAPFGTKVTVRKRQLEGPKLDDLAPRWITGTYVGKSDSLHKGHLVYVKDDGGERFVHTLHVRSSLHDPGPVEGELFADEPEGPRRRLRGKSAGSGDVVVVTKLEVDKENELKHRAEAVLQTWSQEEAEDIVKAVCAVLAPSENVYGMFRFGGKTGITRATVERPWLAKVLLKLMVERAPEAEFAAIFVSVNNEREVHIDRNNAFGTLNYLLPLVMPRRGGEIWQELRPGDVVQGRVLELQSPDGRTRYGCSYPLQEGSVFQLNPHRRHAVLPWTGDRLVIVGYTPGTLQNLSSVDREHLWTLGFPMPIYDEGTGAIISINTFTVQTSDVEKDIVVEYHSSDLPDSTYDLKGPEGSMSLSTTSAQTSGSEIQGVNEEWSHWDMCLVLDGTEDTVILESSLDRDTVQLAKAEVSFTEGVEKILSALDGPLNVVHTVNPREVAMHFEEWAPSLKKEVMSLAHAVEKVWSSNSQVQEEISSGRAQVIPMKAVFTVKPPDPPQEGEAMSSFFKRKSRIVICGNLASHQPGEVYTNTAPAELVRAALAFGLQESPRLWGMYRDLHLAQIQIVHEGKRVTLLQGRVEPSWWSVLQEGSIPIGILVVYVDDLLLCGHPSVIQELASAVKAIWSTNDLQMLSDGTIRFLGIEISRCSQGFALSQRSYIEELARLHNLPATRKDVVPASKELATFSTMPEEGEYTEAELKAAQQCAGELLWVSQRTRPDLGYVASLVGSLSTKAPRRAVQIAEKTIGFLQRTIDQVLVMQADGSGLTGYSDASFAPDGERSHSGAVTVQSGMSVDYGVVTWAILWSGVILALVIWELLKWLAWLVYDNVAPGSKSRRLKRLSKLRDATTEAIQKEIEARAGGRIEQRAKIPPAQQSQAPVRASSTALSSSSEVQAVEAGQRDERINLLRQLASGKKEHRDAQCQTSAFTQ
ncbi:RE1, partial [Symbiodinium sp. CCMP2456]